MSLDATGYIDSLSVDNAPVNSEGGGRINEQIFSASLKKGDISLATLYNIAERYQNLLELCGDENINPELLDSALAQLDGEIEDKVSGGIAVIQELKHRAESYDAEIKRLQRLKKSAESGVERIKHYYFDNLNSVGKTKVATKIGTMAIIQTGGKRPLIIDNEDLIPIELKRCVTTAIIDKDTIREALERGIPVNGAHLGERSYYLKVY